MIDEYQMKKAAQDSKEHGFGIYDTKWGIRINPADLIYIRPGKKKGLKKTMREEICLRSDLRAIVDVYKKKYGDVYSMNLDLFNTNVEEFIERLIRSVEICTLRYALNDENGGLNKCEHLWIVKGRKAFLWEHE